MAHKKNKADAANTVNANIANENANRATKNSGNSNSLENKSLEELHKQIEKGKRKISRSVVFAIAALVAIVAIGIAWFVSNTKVSAIGARVSAENPVSFELGSTGYRQTVEQKYFKENDNSILNEGTNEPFERYVDISTGEEISGSISLQTGTSNLAWYLNGQENFWPGASGKFEFYIIPKIDNLRSVTVTLDLEAYKNKDDNNPDNGVKLVTDDQVKNLIKGHILLFQKLDNLTGYSGGIGEWADQSGTLTITAPTTNNGGVFQNGVPYKVTLYWVWPKYLRNYVYNIRSGYGDLFTHDTSGDYTSMNKFINAQRENATFSQMFYGNFAGTDENKIDKAMSDSVLDYWSQYYNQADEYIGRNAQYIYVNISVQ